MTERYGETRTPRPRGPLIWIHGASVGEILAVIPLIERIHAQGFAVLLTSGTVTSAKLAGQRLPQGVIHQFIPLDAPRFVHRFLDHWRPDLALFVELDLWRISSRPAPSVRFRCLSSTASCPNAHSTNGAICQARSGRCSPGSIFASPNRPPMPSAFAILALRASRRRAISSSTYRSPPPTKRS